MEIEKETHRNSSSIILSLCFFLVKMIAKTLLIRRKKTNHRTFANQNSYTNKRMSHAPSVDAQKITADATVPVAGGASHGAGGLGLEMRRCPPQRQLASSSR
ncbi:translocase inner membrane subunit 44-2 [Striga asiatica]|uniref:Translocase inner membrane subunit 44-2 n=1 Tax=Striga asiatica TaxID=4170 RepID=A0A5A7PC84_STRAF|nr:translocase inner membrane subunit 44-2 [Striga asiatica]